MHWVITKDFTWPVLASPSSRLFNSTALKLLTGSAHWNNIKIPVVRQWRHQQRRQRFGARTVVCFTKHVTADGKQAITTTISGFVDVLTISGRADYLETMTLPMFEHEHTWTVQRSVDIGLGWWSWRTASYKLTVPCDGVAVNPV